MPIHEFLPAGSFDPDMLDVLSAAFTGACADLGVTDKTPHSREQVAKTVIRVADGQRDPQMIRATVVAFLEARQ